MNKIEQAAKTYQESKYSLWTGKGLAKEFQEIFIAGAEWQKQKESEDR